MVRARKSEISAILGLLAEEWMSEEDLAQALLDKFFELLADRNMYGVKWGNTAYGPFITKQSADKLCRALDHVATTHQLVASGALVRIEEQANPADKRYCPDCQHPVFAHAFASPKGCAVKQCECPEVYR